MKILFIGIISLLVLFVIAQAFIMKSTNDTEMYAYKVIKKYDSFEIRKYEPANFTYVTMNASSYKENSGKGFRSLAGYIFGGNEKGEKIAMTSPVAMSLGDSTTTMLFMVPTEYKLGDLPKPNNAEIKFKEEPAKTVAAITFGGWADDEKINDYTLKLKDLLKTHGITHSNNFSFFGYNPPFELINRRNEIIVEIDADSLKSL
jgi:hypothetical protein